MSLALDRSLLEGLKEFSPRQKVFRCREGSMDLLLDPLAVQKPCIQERSAAFRNFDSGDFGQIQGNHVDSLGWSNMSSQRIWKVRIGTDWWAWHWIGRFWGSETVFPKAKGFQVSRRFHGFVVGPPCSSETLHPGEKCGIQELRFRRLWADSGESCGFIGLI